MRMIRKPLYLLSGSHILKDSMLVGLGDQQAMDSK